MFGGNFNPYAMVGAPDASSARDLIDTSASNPYAGGPVNPSNPVGHQLDGIGSDARGLVAELAGKPSGGGYAPSSGSSAKDIYYGNDSALAQEYGMSQEAAYNEALANTAYQRSVKDMQKAGLNPAVLFGGGRGMAAQSPQAMPSFGGSGRSGGGSGRSANGAMNPHAYSFLVNTATLLGSAIGGAKAGLWGASTGAAAGGGLAKSLISLYNLGHQR